MIEGLLYLIGVYAIIFLVFPLIIENVGIEGLFLLAIFVVFIYLTISAYAKHLKEEKQRRVDQQLIFNHPGRIRIKGFDQWLNQEEQLYSSSWSGTYAHYTYPPDWQTRKRYIAAIYNYRCALCSAETKLGHVHHIKHLSNQGDSSITNLVYLCRHCHEDQHDHMKLRKEYRFRQLKKLGITEEEYFKQQKEYWIERRRKESELRKSHHSITLNGTKPSFTVTDFSGPNPTTDQQLNDFLSGKIGIDEFLDSDIHEDVEVKKHTIVNKTTTLANSSQYNNLDEIADEYFNKLRSHGPIKD